MRVQSVTAISRDFVDVERLLIRSVSMPCDHDHRFQNPPPFREPAPTTRARARAADAMREDEYRKSLASFITAMDSFPHKSARLERLVVAAASDAPGDGPAATATEEDGGAEERRQTGADEERGAPPAAAAARPGEDAEATFGTDCSHLAALSPNSIVAEGEEQDATFHTDCSYLGDVEVPATAVSEAGTTPDRYRAACEDGEAPSDEEARAGVVATERDAAGRGGAMVDGYRAAWGDVEAPPGGGDDDDDDDGTSYLSRDGGHLCASPRVARYLFAVACGLVLCSIGLAVAGLNLMHAPPAEPAPPADRDPGALQFLPPGAEVEAEEEDPAADLVAEEVGAVEPEEDLATAEEAVDGANVSVIEIELDSGPGTATAEETAEEEETEAMPAGDAEDAARTAAEETPLVEEVEAEEEDPAAAAEEAADLVAEEVGAVEPEEDLVAEEAVDGANVSVIEIELDSGPGTATAEETAEEETEATLAGDAEDAAGTTAEETPLVEVEPDLLVEEATAIEVEPDLLVEEAEAGSQGPTDGAALDAIIELDRDPDGATTAVPLPDNDALDIVQFEFGSAATTEPPPAGLPEGAVAATVAVPLDETQARDATTVAATPANDATTLQEEVPDLVPAEFDASATVSASIEPPPADAAAALAAATLPEETQARDDVAATAAPDAAMPAPDPATSAATAASAAADAATIAAGTTTAATTAAVTTTAATTTVATTSAAMTTAATTTTTTTDDTPVPYIPTDLHKIYATPVADTWLEYNDTRAYGDRKRLRVDDEIQRITLLKFNLAPLRWKDTLHPEANIVGASLSLYSLAPAPYGGAIDLLEEGCGNEWEEKLVSWTNAPGCVFADTAQRVGELAAPPVADSWNEASLSGLFAGSDGRDFPATAALRVTSPYADGVTYASREDERYAPRLAVHYTLPVGTLTESPVESTYYPTYAPTVSRTLTGCLFFSFCCLVCLYTHASACTHPHTFNIHTYISIYKYISIRFALNLD